MTNVIAPTRQVWVCLACGKMSEDKFGNKKISYGWDVSCVIHSRLCYKDKLVIDKDIVTMVEEGGIIE